MIATPTTQISKPSQIQTKSPSSKGLFSGGSFIDPQRGVAAANRNDPGGVKRGQAEEKATQKQLTLAQHEDQLKQQYKDATDPEKNRNPLLFSDPTQRQAALLSRAQHILESPQYKALTPAQQNTMLSRYYDKYVAPVYTSGKFAAPNKDVWVKGIQESKKAGITPDAYYNYGRTLTSATNFGTKFITGGVGITAAVVHAGVSLKNAAALDMLGLSQFAHHPIDTLWHGVAEQTDEAQTIRDTNDRYHQVINRVSDDFVNIPQFWQETFPSHKLIENASSMVGDVVITLPLYETIGGVSKAVVGGTRLAGEAASAIAKEGSLTKVLMEKAVTPVLDKAGKLVPNAVAKMTLSSLKAASDGVFSAAFMGKDAKESAITGGEFAAFDAAFHGAGKVGAKILSNATIKGFYSKMLAIGGRPFASFIAKQAERELASFDDPKLKAQYDKEFEDYANAKQSFDDPAQKAKADKEFEQHVAAQKATTPEAMPAKSAAEPTKPVAAATTEAAKPKMNFEVVSEAEAKAHAKDPVQRNLINAQKIAFLSIAKKLYGPEVKWSKLTKAQKDVVMKVHSNLGEDGLAELALHNPELAKAHIEKTVAEDAQDPGVAANLKMLQEKYKVDPVASLQKDETESVARQTGAKTSQGAAKASEKLTPMPTAEPTIRKESRDRFASFKVNSLAYFSNPKPKGAPENFDYKKWLSEDEGMSHEQFIKELHDHMMSAGQKFENPEHVLLWGLLHEKKMPPEFGERVQQELHDLDPHVSLKERDKQAQVLLAHMGDLAYTGRLDAEGKIFRSTKVADWTDPTKWMEKLRKEALQAEMDQLAHNYRQYPELVKSVTAQVKEWQKIRIKSATTPKRYMSMSDQIRTTIDRAPEKP